MASKRVPRSAYAAPVLGGTLLLLVAGAGPASAATAADEAATDAGHCILGTLLCGILSGGKTEPTPSPTPTPTAPGTGTAPTKPAHPSKPTAGARPKARPKPKTSGSDSAAAAQGAQRYTLPVGTGITIPRIPLAERMTPLFPDVASRSPQVLSEPADHEQARLTAASGPLDSATPPLLVATAAGLAGAMAAFNVSVIGRRLRRPR